MRTDESGGECPETLGEYRDICAAFGGEDCKAVSFLDWKIGTEKKGRDAVVLAADSQMRMLLMPMLIEKGGFEVDG